MDFASLIRAVEGRTRWIGFVVTSSVVTPTTGLATSQGLLGQQRQFSWSQCKEIKKKM